MKKWKLGSFLIITVVLTLGATNDKKVPEGFKNLKILPKDISKQALDSIMDEYSLSLGVHCGFCHARNADSIIKKLDFASDAKEEKEIARHMMKMTATLNTNDFNFNNSAKPDTIHEIVCYTCHRGKKDPGFDMIMHDYNALKDARMKERQQKMQQQNKQ